MVYFLRLIFKNLYLFLQNKNYRTFHWIAFKIGDSKRYSPRTISFNHFRFYIPDTMSFIWQYKEIFVDEFYYFKTDKREPLIYDCGANIGTSCAYYKSKYPYSRIIAFEADPNICNIFKNNLKENNISQVEVISKAVWTNDNGIELITEGSDGASIYGKGQKTKVDSVRLKSLIEKEDTIDFLKMDIEGAEAEVIKDCGESLQKIQNLFIEYHSFINQSQDLDAILQILKQNKFRYTIYSSHNKSKPFLSLNNKTSGMDLQLNIFASKVN